jgi:hypothetical protein
MKRFLAIAILLSALACDVEDPVKEDTPEFITEVYLTFTPQTGDAVVAIARDPDGEGIADLEIVQPITLSTGSEYTMTISLINGLAEPLDPAHDLTNEVRTEADEHLFLFGWTESVFTSPTGDGNIDTRSNEVLYRDHDANGLPLGLETEWTTGQSASGTFRVVLKHQPGIKSDVSAFDQGETDLDISFPLTIL